MNEKTRAYVERVVAEAPPLSDEQRGRLAQVLRGGRKTLADLPTPDAEATRRLTFLLNTSTVVDEPARLNIEVKP